MDKNIEKIAKEIAKQAHSGQFRRDGVTPYIKHPEAVVNKFKPHHHAMRSIAWLHDVIEDTLFTEDDLYDAGIPVHIIDAVVALTKDDEEEYFEYLKRVDANAFARRVKIADILCNLGDSPTKKQVAKYTKALTFLLEYKQ